MGKIYRAIGLMSGTSMDGVDLALIESDGKSKIISKEFFYQKYAEKFKNDLKKITLNHNRDNLINPEQLKLIENEFTNININTVKDFLSKFNLNAKDIDLIGFHGQTIAHNPEKSFTWQIGNGHLLALKTGINVVTDFRSRDIALGGQGAPLVPIYHFFLLKNQKLPIAVLNIGGISNITYLKNKNENSIEAFDVCFGNAPLDDLVKEYKQMDFDVDGKIAAKGKVNFEIATKALSSELFRKRPPKSFHRYDFNEIAQYLRSLTLEDQLATLCYIHAAAININLDFFTKAPKKIFICGGGRKNTALVKYLKEILSKRSIELLLIEDIGFNGDAIEAQAFAFLAIRSVKNLPISFQKTTGVLQGSNCVPASYQQHSSSCGGVFYRA